jgi:ketosteroid isomerase-like protein
MSLSPADRLEITELGARYALAVDERRLNDVAALFTEDGVLVMPQPPHILDPVLAREGRTAVRAAMDAVSRLPQTFHVLAGTVLEAAGPDAATGTVACTAHHLSESDGEVGDRVWHVRYSDTYRRTGDGWRIARRELAIAFIEQRPVGAWRGAGS